MKNKIYYLAILALLLSCKKEIKQESLPPIPSTNEKQDSKTVFSKALASALEKEPDLRLFIKNEALKQFDRDNDVLFQMVKDEQIIPGKTFHQILSENAVSKSELEDAINTLPTLTIMVPEVVNFSPKSWNVNTEIPQVAVEPVTNHGDIYLYNSKGEREKVPSGLIPGFPVVVVKENERINVSVNNVDIAPNSSRLLKNENLPSTKFLTKKNLKFSFSSEAFNGLKKSPSNTLKNNLEMSLNKTSRIDPTRVFSDGTIANIGTKPLDPLIIEAFNNNLDWQRDYIYYGLNPNAGINKGRFNNKVQEHIVAIRMTDDFISRIQDSPDEPAVYEKNIGRPERPGTIPAWTDGYFDIRISVLLNARNGIGSEKNIIMNVKGSDLYDFKFRKADPSPRPGGNNYAANSYYYYDGLTPKTFYVNEPIVAWDLENYGSGWKFIVTEYDLSTQEEDTRTESTQSTFATNFEYNFTFGENVKVGYKFGSTQQTTSTHTYVLKTSKGSDDIGVGTLIFGDPIILKKEQVPAENTGSTRPPRGGSSGPSYTDYNYITNDVKCGTMYVSVEPRLTTR